MKAFLNRRAFTALALTAAQLPAWAQERYPSRPIKLIVPYPAGGNADNIARVFSRKFSQVLGTPVIVDNKPGASGTIGADAVYKSPTDGYTLLLTVTTQLTTAAVNVRPSYNAIEDFTPIVGLCVTPLAFAVTPALGVRSLRELAAIARKQKLSYGSYGTGTSTHVMQHLLYQQMQSLDAVHVPYRGESPMVNDMLGGQIHSGMLPIGVAREMERTGRMRILAMVGPQRSEFLPNIPTFQEQGFGKLDWTYGVAVYGASRLPADIMQRLQDAGRKVMADRDTQQAFRNQSNEPWVHSTPEELKKRLVIDTVLWNKTMSALGPLE